MYFGKLSEFQAMQEKVASTSEPKEKLQFFSGSEKEKVQILIQTKVF